MFDDNDQFGYEHEGWPENDEDEWNCCMPGECLMPGEHMRSECHNAQMLEDQMSSHMEGQPLDDFMDCLTHSDDDWEEECRGGIVRTPDGDLSLLVLVQDECLADPQLSKWRNAFVWQLCEKYGDSARVLLRHEVTESA